MAGLTVTEKEHWKQSIERRIERRIEVLTSGTPGLMDRVRREARQRAVASLDLAELQVALDRTAEEMTALQNRERDLRRTMLARVRGVAIEDLGNVYGTSYEMQEVTSAITKRQKVHEDELMAGDETGRQVLHLRLEQERLLDTIWLATSSAEIRTLWSKVGELLGDEPTRLEREALTIPAGGEA